jgi:Flp pilus assembly pilin Flp
MARFRSTWFRRFRRSEDGVAVVEFVLCVPLMILILAIVMEFGRLFLGYQSTVSGVRNASRYLARVAPIDICDTGGTGGSLSTYETLLQAMIEKDRQANIVLPTKFTVTKVDATYICAVGTYRISPAPVATVAAQITVEFPFGFMFSLFGTPLGTLSTAVSDTSRILGQ